jgi:hypothetical protein
MRQSLAMRAQDSITFALAAVVSVNHSAAGRVAT